MLLPFLPCHDVSVMPAGDDLLVATIVDESVELGGGRRWFVGVECGRSVTSCAGSPGAEAVVVVDQEGSGLFAIPGDGQG